MEQIIVGNCNHGNDQKINGQCIQCAFFENKRWSKPKKEPNMVFEDGETREFDLQLYYEKTAARMKLDLEFWEVVKYTGLFVALGAVTGLFYFL